MVTSFMGTMESYFIIDQASISLGNGFISSLLKGMFLGDSFISSLLMGFFLGDSFISSLLMGFFLGLRLRTQ